MFSVKFITKCNSENLHLIYFKHCRLIKNHKKQMKWSLRKPLEFIKLFSNQWDNHKNREQSATIWRIYAMMLEGKG